MHLVTNYGHAGLVPGMTLNCLLKDELFRYSVDRGPCRLPRLRRAPIKIQLPMKSMVSCPLRGIPFSLIIWSSFALFFSSPFFTVRVCICYVLFCSALLFSFLFSTLIFSFLLSTFICACPFCPFFVLSWYCSFYSPILFCAFVLVHILGGGRGGGHRYAAAADDSELCERRVPAAGRTLQVFSFAEENR